MSTSCVILLYYLPTYINIFVCMYIEVMSRLILWLNFVRNNDGFKYSSTKHAYIHSRIYRYIFCDLMHQTHLFGNEENTFLREYYRQVIIKYVIHTEMYLYEHELLKV